MTEEAAAPRVAFRTFESEAAAGTVSYHFYRPAEYDAPGARLPVLYWLHGTLGGVSGVRPLAAHFDTECYHEIPDVGHDAAAVLAALATSDGDFYRRALATPDAQDR